MAPNRTYSQPDTVFVGLRVTDEDGASDTLDNPLRIDVGNDPPSPTISQPLSSQLWEVDEIVNFAGAATDPQQGTLPASALDWELLAEGVPLESFPDTASGQFSPPDRSAPTDLTMVLTATDAQGATASTSVTLDPKTVELTLASAPTGLDLGLNGSFSQAPFSATVVEGSTNTLSATSPQQRSGTTFDWQTWSDGGEATHSISADGDATYSALFSAFAVPDPTPPVNEPPPPANPALVIQTLKQRVPASSERLIARGARAKLRCNLDCQATFKLVAEGRRARRIGIDGTIAKQVVSLASETPTWVTATLRPRPARLLQKAAIDVRVASEITAR